VRIAIVNDVAIAVEALRRVIGSVPGYRLAWVAVDGADAVERCRQDTPDLILMDLIMPVMDGAEATRRIMANSPCAILIVTATLEGNSGKVFEALGAGALDVVQTPIFGGRGQMQGAATLKVKIDSVGKLVSGAIRRFDSLERAGSVNDPDSGLQLVAIGASAGGPGALAAILGGLPADFPAAIVIVQHLDPEFVPLFAGWLNERSALPVRVARQGDQPQASTALIAETGDHLVFVNPHSLGYVSDPQDCCYRPSVDVFFESVVRHWKGSVAGVLLTGMGKDGSSGLKALRDCGSLTIAQDSASCVVYGMPKAAKDLGAVMEILPLEMIAGGLIAFASSQSSAGGGKNGRHKHAGQQIGFTNRS
jgi:two-component system, chemotaxis family, response regulator WspF